MFGSLFGKKEKALDINQDDWGSDGRLTGDAADAFKSGDYTSVSQDGGAPIKITETSDGVFMAEDDV